MSSRLTGRLQILAVSVAILVAVTLQGIAAFAITVGPIERPPFLWPFLDYPMYEQPRYAGEPIVRQVVVGVLADSTDIVLAPADLGVTFWQFQNILNRAILRDDQAGAEAYRGIYEERYGRSLVAFRLEGHPLVMTEDGLVAGSPVVLGSLGFDPE